MSTTSYISGIIHDTKYIIGVMSLKRYRYRAYPKKGQKQPIAALFGCVRVVYNDALAYSEEQYKDTGKKPSSKELSARLKGLGLVPHGLGNAHPGKLLGLHPKHSRLDKPLTG